MTPEKTNAVRHRAAASALGVAIEWLRMAHKHEEGLEWTARVLGLLEDAKTIKDRLETYARKEDGK